MGLWRTVKYPLLLAVLCVSLWWGWSLHSNLKPRVLVPQSNWKSLRHSATSPHTQTSVRFGPYVGKYFEDVCNHTEEWLVECSSIPSRPLTQLEAKGGDILFSIKTTKKYHNKRPKEIIETWLRDVDPSTVFFVTDTADKNLQKRLKSVGMNLVVARVGKTHRILDLCEKTGAELELMFDPKNTKYNWFCQVDDDMYVIVKSLIKALSHFNPKKEPVYFGRSGYRYADRWPVNYTDPFPYAQGGMYCFSRVMLEKAKDYIIGADTFKETCRKAWKNDDITLGLVIAAVVNESMNCTSMIFTHYPEYQPDNVDAPYFKDQIVFPYGFGTKEWSVRSNITTIPGKLFTEAEDVSQFRSFHCFLNPTLDWCVKKKKKLNSHKS